MSSLAKFYAKQLTDDLVWREAELSVMRKYLLLAERDSSQEAAMLRAGTAMLYAHYEGFCKFAIDTYIDALEKLKLKRGQLSWPLATLSLGKLRRKASECGGLQEFYETIFDGFNMAMQDIADYERPQQIANLWPDLLLDWLAKLNLEHISVKDQSVLLESLVNNRNQIAHGKKLIIASREELDKYFHAATLAMHEVAVGVVDALELKTYSRPNTNVTIINHANK